MQAPQARALQGVVLLASLLVAGCASRSPMAAVGPEAYRGSWAYAQSCGRQHSARLDIDVVENDVARGAWNDGTPVAGQSGHLTGRVRDGRLDLRLCPESGDCPAPSAPADAYLRREGERLVWYRRYGGGQAARDVSQGDERYLTLHRVVGDADPPTDDDCADQANASAMKGSAASPGMCRTGDLQNDHGDRFSTICQRT